MRSFAQSADSWYDSCMKTRTHYAVCWQEYLAAAGLDPDKAIYFDIETTGFRASTSSLYMIGWAVRASSAGAALHSIPAGEEKRGEWIVTQLLAESRSEEFLLLKQFAAVLKEYDTVIEFNGDRFDLPYIKEKYASYALEDPLSHLESIDLYREIRPFRKALGLDRLNQKSVEAFLQIGRKDPYNGGQLIDVYRDVRDRKLADPSAAVDALFLHNEEDVLGMLAMTGLLGYSLAIQQDGAVRIRTLQSDDGSLVMEAAYELALPVPTAVHFSFENCCDITFSGRNAAVVIRPCAGTLYHFFPDFRNYYYLPEEDMAIHKSVASFVDPAHREKAKAQNCYVKKEGVFLPLPEGCDASDRAVFSRSCKDKVRWFEYEPGMIQDPDLIASYVHDIIKAAASQ